MNEQEREGTLLNGGEPRGGRPAVAGRQTLPVHWVREEQAVVEEAPQPDIEEPNAGILDLDDNQELILQLANNEVEDDDNLTIGGILENAEINVNDIPEPPALLEQAGGRDLFEMYEEQLAVSRGLRIELSQLVQPIHPLSMILKINRQPVLPPPPGEAAPPVELGSRVRIKEESPYAQQNFHPGAVTQVYDGEQQGWVEVKFDDGRRDDFPVNELTTVTREPGECTLLAPCGKICVASFVETIQPNIGDIVRLCSKTGNVLSIHDGGWELGGTIVIVKEVLADGDISIEDGGNVSTVKALPGIDELKAGHRAVLYGNSVIIKNLGEDDSRFKLNAATGVNWENIGGHDDAKLRLRESMELPIQHPELYKMYGMKPPKGVLLYGPPGCGKTLIGKALASAFAELHGAEAVESGFISVKGPEVLSKWVGEAEATIRGIFARARKHYEEHGYPAVVFWDEADALFPIRGSRTSTDIDATIVPTFLSEVDGLSEIPICLLLSTNRPDTLDPAVVRDGRIDVKVYIGRPTKEQALEIFKIHMAEAPIPEMDGWGLEGAAQFAVDELYSPARVLYAIQRKSGENLEFTLGNISSGAMIEGIVSEAKLLGLRQSIKTGRMVGIGPKHLQEAVNKTFEENRHLDHKAALEEMTHDFRDDIAGIHRVSAGT